MPSKARKLVPNKKCKWGNKRCITYDNKRITYNNKADLVKKFVEMGMREPQAKKWVERILNDNTKRVAIKDNGDFETFDIRENFKGMLKTYFNINRVLNKKVIIGEKIKDVEIVRKTNRFDHLNSTLTVMMYVNWDSPEYVTPDDIQDADGNVDVDLLQEYIRNGAVVVRKKNALPYNGAVGARDEFVKQFVQQYANTLNNARIIAHRYNTLTTYTKSIADRSDYMLGDIEYQLTDWANIQYLGKWIRGEDSCAVKFISLRFPKLYWQIKKIETSAGVSIGNFVNFCNQHAIMFVLMKIDGEEIFLTNINDTQFKNIPVYNRHQALHAIIYESHIYPFSGGKLVRVPAKPMRRMQINDCDKKLLKFVDKNVIPRSIKTTTRKNGAKSEVVVESFVHKSIKYFCNPEFDRCFAILKSLGLAENVPTDIGLMKLPEIILKARKAKFNVLSFLPQKDNYKSKAILWQKAGINDYHGPDFAIDDANDKKKVGPKRKIVGIDKNKAYPHALANLKYLIRHDWRIHSVKDIQKEKNHQMVDHYLYLVKAKYFVTILPSSGLYPGYHLKECIKLNIEFELIEELETDQCFNFYTDLINDLRNVLDASEFKKLMVILIGKMEQNITDKSVMQFSSIHSNDDARHYSGHSKKIGKEKTMFFRKRDTISNVRDQLPINIQIKCFVYLELNQKIRELELGDGDIVQINTDSIWYHGSYPEKKLDNNDFNGWKKIDNSKFKSISHAETKFTFDSDLFPTLTLQNPNTATRILHMKYAGAGKTHYIINQRIPWLVKNKISYIVLTASNDTIEEYRKASINCQILQKYCFDKTIPEEQYIIIDEIGICGPECHDFIFKLNENNKSFEVFGDFFQMLPPGESRPYNQPHYLQYLFSEIRTEFVNFRNDFTKQYYDELINAEINLVSEVQKYSSPLHSAEIAICYRNKIRDETNKKILKKMGLSPFSAGTRVICINNKLKHLNIWNRKQFTIKSVYEDKSKDIQCDLIDTANEIVTLLHKTVIQNFRHSYCINVYSAQGKSFSSFHWVADDDIWLSNQSKRDLRSRIAYTVISRLKNKQNTCAPNIITGLIQLDMLENSNKDIVVHKTDDDIRSNMKNQIAKLN